MCFQWEEEKEKHRMMPKRTVSQICLDTGPKVVFFQFQVFFSKVWMVLVLLSLLRARSLHNSPPYHEGLLSLSKSIGVEE
jgi:hypothetical protein